LIKDAFEDVGGNVLRINVGIPFPDGSINKAFLQILCGTWASILDKEWCISKGCWNGDLFEDIAPADGIPDWYMTWRHVAASPIDPVTPANYAGSGPYHVTVAEQIFGLVIMTRNPGHWRGWPAPQKKAYLDNIDIEYIEDWYMMQIMFDACQLDY
jgi:ABC-type transport system substrate-binding protein